ncbi:MAG: hypothetical protein IKG70_01140 [Lachnospiraceae bacterium]|nr:hypothetical protein [Lachnospiraceae bacterium]
MGERHTDKVLRITEALNIISKNARPDVFAEAAEEAGLRAVARLYFVLLRSVIPETSRADDFLSYLPEDHFYLDYTKQLAKLCRLFGPGAESLSLRKKVSLHNGRKHIQKMIEKQKEKTDVR